MRFALLAIALLCLLAYAPSLSLPLFEDDYGNLIQAQVYGPPAGLPQLMHDAVFRLRATSYWAMWLLWRAFHLTPWGYHLASLILHIANAWLVYALAASWQSTRPAAFWAAAFFAVAEGHQEAVIWFSAINELLLFFFGAASLLCWVRADRARRPWLPRLGSAALFALALLSKESAVILLPLFPLASPAPLRRAVLRLAPHIALAGLAIASVLASRSQFVPLFRWQLFARRAFLDHLAPLRRAPAMGLGMALPGHPGRPSRARCGKTGLGRRNRRPHLQRQAGLAGPRLDGARPASLQLPYLLHPDTQPPDLPRQRRTRIPCRPGPGAALRLETLRTQARGGRGGRRAAGQRGVSVDSKTRPVPRAGRAHRATHRPGPAHNRPHLGPLLSPQRLHRPDRRATRRRPAAVHPGLERSRSHQAGATEFCYRER